MKSGMKFIDNGQGRRRCSCQCNAAKNKCKITGYICKVKNNSKGKGHNCKGTKGLSQCRNDQRLAG